MDGDGVGAGEGVVSPQLLGSILAVGGGLLLMAVGVGLLVLALTRGGN